MWIILQNTQRCTVLIPPGLAVPKQVQQGHRVTLCLIMCAAKREHTLGANWSEITVSV